jgi:lipopolysaccharide transport system ATP-binding protein
MSSDEIAIDIRGLVKTYRIVDPLAPTNLREAIMRRLRHPLSDNVGNEVFPALSDVDLKVHRGEVLGLIGHNGAGKSTLLKVITGITSIDAGEVDLLGRVGCLIEVGTGFHPDLTGRENVYLNGAILGMTRSEIDRKFNAILEFAEVGDFIETPIKRYSTGMAVRLAFSVAVHLDAEILLIDEVLAVGDAGFQAKCLEKIDQIASEGERTLILVSHNMANIRRACHRVVVLEKGQVAYLGAPEEATRRYVGSARYNSSSVGDVDLSGRDGPGYLTGIALEEGHGHRTATFQTGQPMRAVVRLSNLDNVVRPGVVVRICNRSDMSVASFVGTSDVVAASGGQVVLNIPSMPLAPDRYWLDVSVFSIESEATIDSVRRAIAFDVSSHQGEVGRYQALHGDGAVIIPAQWSTE